jgi:hypothetical protein
MLQVVMAFGPYPTFIKPGVPGPYTGEDLGVMWLKHTAKISGELLKAYDLILLVPRGTLLPEEEINAWKSVRRFDENSKIEAWPLGPNTVFQQVLWFQIHGKIKGSFLWIEPDCIPLSPEWLDRIAGEYIRENKPFMGAYVDVQTSQGFRIPPHMTGNGVYPEDAYKLAPKLLEARMTPWDVYSAREILKRCHFTSLIQHEYRYEEIQTLEDYRKIVKPEAVVFHTDKFGAIIRLLGGTGVSAEHHQTHLNSVKDTSENSGKPLVEVFAQSEPLVVNPEFGRVIDHRHKEPPDLDELLEMIRLSAENNSLDKEKIAWFIMRNGIVDHSNWMKYLRKKKRENALESASS